MLLRHRDYIDAKELARATAFSTQDSETWADNFKRCPNLMSGHDESHGRKRAMPDSEDFLQHVASMDTWVSSLREGQKDLLPFLSSNSGYFNSGRCPPSARGHLVRVWPGIGKNAQAVKGFF